MSYHALPYFWNWFRRNRNQFNLAWKHRMDRDYLLMELNGYLQAYCKCLRCYIGMDEIDQSPKQLIITADGDPDYFEEAQFVVNEGPSIPGWQIISLLPPVPPDWNLGWYFDQAPFSPWDVYIFATYHS